MSSVDMGEGVAGALRGQDRGSPLYSVADLLCLAAAPTFAAMALLPAKLIRGSVFPFHPWMID